MLGLMQIKLYSTTNLKLPHQALFMKTESLIDVLKIAQG